jgi:hypothetical protein
VPLGFGEATLGVGELAEGFERRDVARIEGEGLAEGPPGGLGSAERRFELAQHRRERRIERLAVRHAAQQ